MLRRPLARFVLIAVAASFTLYVASCAGTSNKRPSSQAIRTSVYKVTFEWTGDDGLSLAFKRALQSAIDSNPLFNLSYYGDADIVIDNTSNVRPIFSEDKSINSFRYRVIAYRRISPENKMELGSYVGECSKDDITGCAVDLITKVQKTLLTKKSSTN